VTFMIPEPSGVERWAFRIAVAVIVGAVAYAVTFLRDLALVFG
jgi:hypothetical protein